jgi:hypothetical protein
MPDRPDGHAQELAPIICPDCGSRAIADVTSEVHEPYVLVSHRFMPTPCASVFLAVGSW